MTQETNQKSTIPNYFVSPGGKIHAQTCRHCQHEKEGWQRLGSFTSGIEKGYQACRLCCPSNAETQSLPPDPIISVSDILVSEEKISTATPSEKDKSANKNQTNSDKTDKIKDKSTQTKSQQKTPQKSAEKVEKKRYKILAGNGCHQAIAEVQGILVPPSEPEQHFILILPDGFQIEVTFKTPRLYWIAHNQDKILGSHWFRGYPKMKDDKLVSLQIIAWDKNMPTNPRGFETWEFTGVWTAQKNITVQRSMMMEDVRKIAKETGFIKKFKYTFTNSFEWVKNKKLWMGYVYKVLCQRKGDTLEIKKVIPYACPRFKPDPKGFNKRDDGKNNYHKAEKKDFRPAYKKPKD